jgi:hypothetical protein
MNEEQACSVVLEHLEQITQARHDVRAALRSMHTIFSALHTYNFSNETLEEFVSENAIQIIMEAILRDHSAPPKLVHQGIGSLNEIIQGSQERSAFLITSIGLDAFFDLMELNSSDTLLQILLLGLFAEIGSNVVERDLIAPYSAKIIQRALEFMEEHSESPKVFHATSCVFLAWGPPEAENVDRLIQNVWYGLSNHADDGDAQDVGRQLLRALFGPHVQISSP